MTDETKKRARGRPAVQPPDLKLVEELAARGLTLDQVARSLGLSLRTLQRKKRASSQLAQALEVGHAAAVAAMSDKLSEMAMNGSLTAEIFWLRRRVSWRDSDAGGVGVNMNLGPERRGLSAEVERAPTERQTQLIERLGVEREPSLMPPRQVVLGQASQAAALALSETGEPRQVTQSRRCAPTRNNPDLPQVRLPQLPKASADGSPSGALPTGVCPKCGRVPHRGEEPIFNNGVPISHLNCRPRW